MSDHNYPNKENLNQKQRLCYKCKNLFFYTTLKQQKICFLCGPKTKKIRKLGESYQFICLYPECKTKFSFTLINSYTFPKFCEKHRQSRSPKNINLDSELKAKEKQLKSYKSPYKKTEQNITEIQLLILSIESEDSTFDSKRKAVRRESGANSRKI